MFNSVFNFNFLAVVVSEIIWGPKLTSGRHAPLAENFYTKCEYFTISSVFLNFRFLSLVVSELLGGPKFTLGDLSPPESFIVEKFLDPKRVLYSI